MKVYNLISLTNGGDEGYAPSVSVTTYLTREAAQKDFDEEVACAKDRYGVDEEDFDGTVEDDDENIFTMTDSLSDEFISFEIREMEAM